jgi:hypothetical protein
MFLLLLWGLSHARVSLDTHVHFQTKGVVNPFSYNMRPITPSDSMAHFQSVLEQDYLDRFFLLSEAYLSQDFLEAISKNDKIFDLSKQYPRAIPVCGLNLKMDFYKMLFNACLGNKTAVGFKMHLAYDNTFLEGQIVIRFHDVLSSVPKDRPIFFLVHYHQSALESARTQKQVESLLALSQNFPHVKFIIAHAATTNPNMLLQIAEYYHLQPEAKRNIYLETSTLFNTFHKNKNDDDYTNYYGYSLAFYVDVFEKFGMERVLYGSDTFVNNPVGRQEVDFILNAGFNFYQQERILELNGEQFLMDLEI